MPDSLWSAATGMLAQQTSMDSIANNLANVNTQGFKRGRTSFQDLLYRQLSPKEAAKQGSEVGTGTRVGAIQTQFEQGALQTTGQPLDLALEGDGFFEVSRPDGTKAYTRAGNFTTNAAGVIVTQGGDVVSPKITVPANAQNLSIGADGTVSATIDGKAQSLGQIKVATFPNEAGLESVGSSLYAPSANSGAVRLVNPGASGAGAVRQGELEGSNVNAVDEMVGMVSTQRAYEAVSKVVSAADEMLGMANSLRR
jgi:flagellar basal-body rod protein FlgG